MNKVFTKQIAFVVFIITLASCTKYPNENIVLSHFSEEIIEAFIKEEHHNYFNKELGLIILNSSTASKEFDNSVLITYWEKYQSKNYIGQTKLDSLTVKVYGDKNPIYFSVEKKANYKEILDVDDGRCDRSEWGIYIIKDTIYCYDSYNYEDPRLLMDICKKYFPEKKIENIRRYDQRIHH